MVGLAGRLNIHPPGRLLHNVESDPGNNPAMNQAGILVGSPCQTQPDKNHPAYKSNTRPDVYDAGDLAVSIRYGHADDQPKSADQGVSQNLYVVYG